MRRAYRAASRRHRLHLAGRWWSCPFVAVEAWVPPTGQVLDVGCGHGTFSLYLALTSPDRVVTGVDIDHAKIDLARQAADELSLDNVCFEVVEPTADLAGRWDAVTFIDVLYLLGHIPAQHLLAAAVGALEPGGVIVTKEMDMRPRWKLALNRLQELVATKVARITRGRHVDVVPPELVEAVLADAGLTVTRRRLDRHRVHPHHLIVGSKPSSVVSV